MSAPIRAIAHAALTALLLISAAIAAPRDPSTLRVAFEAALGDRAALAALLTDSFAAADLDRIDWLSRAASGEQTVVLGVRAEGERAVMTVRSGPTTVLLLAVDTPAGWRVDDSAADPAHAVGFLAGAPRRAPPDPALRAFADRLANAIEARNAPALLASTHPDAVHGQQRREAGLFWQFLHKALGLRVTDARSRAGRGVIDADVMRGDRAVDRIRLIAVARPPTWQIAEITENPAHAAAWLAGDAPARLDVERLPGHPEVKALAGQIRAALIAKDSDALVGLLVAAPGETPGMGAPRLRTWLRGDTLRAITAVGQPRIHHHAESGRALAELTLALPRRGDRVEQTHTLYFQRVGGRWRWIDLGFVTHRSWVFGLAGR